MLFEMELNMANLSLTKSCVKCKSGINLVEHHPDYSKPDKTALFYLNG